VTPCSSSSVSFCRIRHPTPSWAQTVTNGGQLARPYPMTHPMTHPTLELAVLLPCSSTLTHLTMTRPLTRPMLTWAQTIAAGLGLLGATVHTPAEFESALEVNIR